jgi:phenylalanyl-tRNA synthetase beta chain
MNPQEVADALTAIGLETGYVEEVQPVKGGLEGLIIGQVLTCIEHPNSDHLHVTSVNTGGGEPVKIVCGAPNVAAGQKVVVATVGTTLYSGDEEFKIKKSKIRGEESFGMICAEDEIGLGTDHAGIIVLPEDAPVGMPAKTYYNIESDYILEVDITPNRVDATSHIGVARDLAAYLTNSGIPSKVQYPSVESFRIDDAAPAIGLEVKDPEACIRYSGVTIKGVEVKESPGWLKNRLKSIGLRPINNIVDITNYILHETGQPLHAFDAGEIAGNKVVVETKPNGTKFVTLDGVERTLTDKDLMICDTEKPMCIGGVFGGLNSGVTGKTKDVFLESACFNPSRIRKTSRRFGLNTDASFRFERGLDPNSTLYVLKRAALLIKEIAGGVICGEIQDFYQNRIEPFKVDISYNRINSLTGKTIPVDKVKNILDSLEIIIESESPEGLSLSVPVYRFDVRRQVDVIEDILRIYGYNNIELSGHLHSSLSYQTNTDKSYNFENIISEQLCGAGFNEILNNSLTKSNYYEGLSTYHISDCVKLKNPTNTDLNVMRQTLLFGGLQSIYFNLNRKNRNIHFFEFGNCYRYDESAKKDNMLATYNESYMLALWISGNIIENNWAHKDESSSVFELKAHVENILRRLGINTKNLLYSNYSNEIFSTANKLTSQSGKEIGNFGIVNKKILKLTDIDNDVFYAELNWKELIRMSNKVKITMTEIPKYPEVKRDLALLVDKEITFADIKKVALQSENKLLKKVVLFDVYEGKNLITTKKSYAVSFFLQDLNKTLTDKQIDDVMSGITKNLEQKLDAQLR